MKKILYILIIGLTFINCDNTIKKKSNSSRHIFYYPRITSFQNDTLLTKIDLDSLKNFGELLDKSENIVCDRKIPLIEFRNNNKEFKIIMDKECLEALNIADYKERDVIFIQGDSIIINDKMVKPFDSIKNTLERHILNQGKDSSYSTNIEKAIIFYHQEKSYSSERIKDQLLKIALELNEIRKIHGDSIPLKMKLQDYGYIYVEIPPMPEE